MIKILFVCTGNSCRSQMAQGFINALYPGQARAFSAGVTPTELNPDAAFVMDELGIELRGQGVHRPEDYAGIDFNYIITLCDDAKKNCPYVSGWGNARRVHLGFQDPATFTGSRSEVLSGFRRIRDEIRQTMVQFLKEEESILPENITGENSPGET